MDHYSLDDELRKQLIESAAWGKADITPRLDEEVIEEKKKDDGESKGDKGKDKDDPEAKDYEDGGDRKGDESKTKKGKKDYEDDDKRKDEAVAHACPLCASELSEAIDEERILEHLNVVVGLVDRLSQLQEGDEDIDSVIDETIAQLLLQDEAIEEE